MRRERAVSEVRAIPGRGLGICADRLRAVRDRGEGAGAGGGRMSRPWHLEVMERIADSRFGPWIYGGVWVFIFVCVGTALWREYA